MGNLAMDMVTGNGYLLIPGFLVLVLFLAGCFNCTGCEVKTEGCRGAGTAADGSRRYGRR